MTNEELMRLAEKWRAAVAMRWEIERYINTVEDEPEDRMALADAEVKQESARSALSSALAEVCSEVERHRSDMSRIHCALKDAGWHPGRTDDLLADIIKRMGAEIDRLRAALAAPAAEPVARKPLRVSQIVRLAHRFELGACDQSQTTAFARAVERAHGIE